MKTFKGFGALLGVARKCHFISSSRLPNCVVVHPEVEKTLLNREPLVALETALVTHGLPYPHNLNIALQTQEIIREQGAVPATIAVIGGKIRVGIDHDQLVSLAKCDRNKCVKVASRDLPYALSKNLDGGTTVSGTLVICNLVGISVFATGGIGGVHRDGQVSMDVSSDLIELGRNPVAVVSAGVKSILDVGRTLEHLETQGICVTVLGDSPSFPDFFTRTSGYEAPSYVQDPQEAAQLLLRRSMLGLRSGILIAVPIPEEFEADGQSINDAIDKALKEAQNSRITGRDVTPFVLKRVQELTKGTSLHTNMQLLRNNAKEGARIAVAYSKILKDERFISKKNKNDSLPSPRPHGNSSIVVIGGSIVDLVSKITEETVDITGKTHQGELNQSFGGVGRNLADALTRLGCQPLFISAVGKDPYSDTLMDHNSDMEKRGFMKSSKFTTAYYNALLDHKGELLIGVGDMNIHSTISPHWVGTFEKDLLKASLVVLDGNVSLETINTVFELCSPFNIPIWYEPTDQKKATKPWLCQRTPTFMSPNINEFNAILGHITNGAHEVISTINETFAHDVLRACHHLDWAVMTAALITFGRHGYLIVRKVEEGEDENCPLVIDCPREGNLVGLLFSSRNVARAVSVSGAGDCLAAGFILGMLQGATVRSCAALGTKCAIQSLLSIHAVPESLNLEGPCPPPLPYQLIR